MGLLSFLRRLLCGAPAAEAPAPAVLGAEDDTVFDSALFSVDAEALRAQANAAGDAAAATSAASREAYAAGDKAKAKELSQSASARREQASALHAQAARAIFAQKNRERGQYEIDLHLLLVAEAVARTKRRLTSCAAVLAAQPDGGKAGHDLCIIYGQGHHSVGNVQKIKPAVLELLSQSGAWCDVREGVPNPGCVTVKVLPAARAKL